MLLEHEDLTLDQEFHLANGRRHLAELHGYGTVCGLKVESSEGHHEVIIRKGVAVDCVGREIRVDQDIELNLDDEVQKALTDRESAAQRGSSGAVEEPRDEDGLQARSRPVHLYVSLSYHERPERPVQAVRGPETSCEPGCEMSRVRQGLHVEVSIHPPKNPHDVDGFIKELEHCQHTHLNEFLSEFITDRCRTCVPDPCDREHHCVCLARVEAWPDGEIGEIDNCSARQLALSTTMLAGLVKLALKRTGRP
jgi:hypothetical protein